MRLCLGSRSFAGIHTFPGCHMAVELTAVYQAVPEGYIAVVQELPGANTQGATLQEARANLREDLKAS